MREGFLCFKRVYMSVGILYIYTYLYTSSVQCMSVCMLVKQGSKLCVCVCFCFYYKGNAQTGPHNIHVCVHVI